MTDLRSMYLNKIIFMRLFKAMNQPIPWEFIFQIVCGVFGKFRKLNWDYLPLNCLQYRSIGVIHTIMW